MTLFELDKIIKLRHYLHQNPELSGNEKNTAEKIIHFINQYEPDQLVSASTGNGFAFIFRGKDPGTTVLFRAELDALPIKETNKLEYNSNVNCVSHVCGHDGHMCLLTGLASHVKNHPIQKGKLILLFQPAEETGEGAKQLISDQHFIDKLKPDFVFALHNLPGFETNTVLINNSIFCRASNGLTIKLKGISSHAAEPEKGISPAQAIAKIISEFEAIPDTKLFFEDEVSITIIHINLGEKAFGIAPANAEISATFRTIGNSDMELLKKVGIERIEVICKNEGLDFDYSWSEEFPTVENNIESNGIIAKAAENLGLEIQFLKESFKWSEDFSWFTRHFKGALFGLGAGISQPNLHNPNYDFPDELIPEGVRLLYEIYKKVNAL